TARSSSFATAWLLASIMMYDASIRSGLSARSAVLRRAAAVAFGAAALGTKEAAVVLPLLVIVWDRARSDGWGWRVTAVRSLPFWAATAALLVVRRAVLGATVGIGEAGGVVQHALFAGKIAVVSFGHWFWPAGLAIDYAWPRVIGSAEAAAILAGVALAAAVTWIAWRRDRRLGWCLAWFWVSLLPVAVLPFVTRVTLYQEHRSYLGGVALAWAVGGIAAACARSLPGHPAVRAAAAAGLVAVSVGAIAADVARTAVWVDHDHLWEDALSHYPSSVLGHNNRGIRLASEGRFAEARAVFEHSLAIDSTLASTHNYLGTVLAQMEHYARAIAEFRLAVFLAPRNSEARLNLGKVYERQGQPEAALHEYERLLDDFPRNSPALARSGAILDAQGRLTEAAERYERVLAVDPSDDGVRASLGAALLRLKRWREAEAAIAPLAERYPDYADVWFNLGVAREELGRSEAALEAFGRSAELDPEDPAPHFRLGVVHAKRGAWDHALIAYERALERDPADLLSHMNAALAAEQRGERRRALTHYAVVIRQSGETDDILRAKASEAMTRLGGIGGPTTGRRGR
ncbi:MAG: tetratricopeptide repeat protein, partial [Nitrospiria bacterium]